MQEQKNRPTDLKGAIRFDIHQAVLARINTLVKGADTTASYAMSADGAMQSKSDTSGVQNSWLSNALSKLASNSHEKLALMDGSEEVDVSGGKIGLNSLVSLKDKNYDGEAEWFFLSEVGAGERLTLDDGRDIFVISPESPLGQELLGKGEGTSIRYEIQNLPQHFEVQSVV